MPVHNRYETQKAPSHRQVGDVGRPNLVRSCHPQIAQQIGVGLVPLRRLAHVGLLVDRHEAHQPHQASDTLVIHQIAFIAQVPGHLPNAKERFLKELLITLALERQVHRRLALGRVIERRPRDRQQLALFADGQVRIAWHNHLPPHLPIHGLSFGDKKSLATASSQILACSSFICSLSISGAFLRPRSNTPDAPSKSARFQLWIIVG
mmetsp:Transcript_6898/g.10928  ORF Transcript_6898/g.10928 Transcript_6898/m.10928 type:complete len:207 (+) Transcript_6898:2399-3019(+)